MVADLPTWIDADFLRIAAGGLVVLSLLLALVLVFVVRSVGTRLVAVVLLGAAVFGLVHYRQTLDHCAKVGCSCKLFGETVEGDNCPTTRQS